jgi:hypothetical protein
MSENWNLFEKNVEIWEKWTNTYMDTMAKAMDKTMEQSTAFRHQMEKAMEQSESFRKQMDEAVATAVNTQLDATLAALKSLEQQVENLSSKIDELLAQE